MPLGWRALTAGDQSPEKGGLFRCCCRRLCRVGGGALLAKRRGLLPGLPVIERKMASCKSGTATAWWWWWWWWRRSRRC